MGKIKIIKEEKFVIPQRPLSPFRVLAAQLARDDVLVLIKRKAFEEIILHCEQYSDEQLEVIGFLLGNVFAFDEGIYVEIEKTVTSDLDSTAINVKFAEEGFEKLFEAMEEKKGDLSLIGWYHSHPGYTCFLSETDINTQVTMFPKPYHQAIVMDPRNLEIRSFSVIDRKVVERTMLLVE